MANKFYAVKKGRKTGIFTTWEACQTQVVNFPGAQYRKFASREEAQAYCQGASATIAPDYDIVAYTDGSYKQEHSEFSYGLVVFYQGQKSTFYEKFADSNWSKMRNVAGEIMGAQKAMAFALAKGAKTLLIHHDYHGIRKWCTGEWQATKPETQAYKKFYDQVASKITINFQWVKGHSGNTFNDEADALATKAFTLKKVSSVPI